MHEYGVTLDDIWNRWTPKQVSAMLAKVSQRKAGEELERLRAAASVIIDKSKAQALGSHIRELTRVHKQYAPNTETTKITDQVRKRFNIVTQE
jgi:hypothetical protein